MDWRNLRRIFSLIGVFFTLSLFWYTDQFTLWPGAETALAEVILGQGNTTSFWLPALISNALATWPGTQLWTLRILLGVGPAILFLAVCWFLGKQVLGATRTWGWLIILVSIPVWVQLAKTATFDTWLGLLQVVAAFVAIQYLKKPSAIKQVISLGSLLLAGWIAPISTLIFSGVLSLLLWRLHSNGRTVIRLGWWAIQVLLIVGIIVFPYDEQPVLWLGWEGSISWAWQIGILTIGILPWIPFLPSVVGDLFRNGRKGEEFSVIFGSLWLAGLLGGGLIALFAVGILLARQVNAFHLPGYPWKNLVKTFALLHLVLAFIIITLAMMSGFYEFGGTGFRAGMAAGSVYWIASFVSVIGLYGQRPTYLWVGMAAAGVWLLFIGNVQIGALVEQERSFVKRAIFEIRATQPSQTISLATDDSRLNTQMQWYTQPGALPQLDSLEWGTGEQWLLSVDEEKLSEDFEIRAIPGRYEIGRPDTLWLGRPIQ